AVLERQREDALLHGPVVDRVVDADEVQRLVAHQRLKLRIPAFGGVGRADVADAAGLLRLPEDAELGRYVAHVVHLHQVDRRLAHARERLLQLLARGLRIRRTAATAGHVELGGPEQPVAEARLLDNPAGHLLRRTVAGRGVEHAAALAHQRFQDLADAGGIAFAG